MSSAVSEGLDLLHEVSKPLEEGDAVLSPYASNAIRRSLSNYRKINLGGIIANPVLQSFLPDNYIRHINDSSTCILVFNIINGEKFSTLFINPKTRAKLLLGKGSGLFYNMGNFRPDFKYGDPVIIVEGSLDCDVIAEIFPDTIALLTSSLSAFQVDLLNLITNKAYLLYDNDETGMKSTARDIALLNRHGIQSRVLNHPPGLSDPGMIADFRHYKHDSKVESSSSYYRNLIAGVRI